MGADQLDHEKVPIKSPSPPEMEKIADEAIKQADNKRKPAKKFKDDKPPLSCFRSGAMRPFKIGAMQNGFDMQNKNNIGDMQKYLKERRKQLAAQKRAKSLDGSVMDIQNGEYLTGDEVIAENAKNLQHLNDTYDAAVNGVNGKTRRRGANGEIMDDTIEGAEATAIGGGMVNGVQAGSTESLSKAGKRVVMGPNGEMIEMETVDEEADYDSEGEVIPPEETEEQKVERVARRKPKPVVRPPLNSDEVRQIKQKVVEQELEHAKKAFNEFRPKSPEKSLETKTEERRFRVAQLEAENKRIADRATRMRQKTEQLEALRVPSSMLQEAVDGMVNFRPNRRVNKPTRSMSMVFH